MSSPWLGKYRLVAELGHGGMADVILAMVAGPAGSGFAKLAVLKRLRATLDEDPEFIAMLLDEARITARLNHANVAQTLEIGNEGGRYFIAMEYLDGQPLHRIQRRAMTRKNPLPRDIEYMILADTLAGLHHAHELRDYDGSHLRVVHRDVTPQNILVTFDGQVKVLDFGVAKAMGRAAETKQGIVKGKIRYMSPEQARGGDIDARADIFAVGLLLWECATKRRFWGDAEELGVVKALIAGEYDPSPRSVDPTVPEEIDAICRKALAYDRADRYESAADFRVAIERFLGERVVAARRELGPLVAEMFKDERERLRAIIERVGKDTLSPPSFERIAAISSAPPSSRSGEISTPSPTSYTPSRRPPPQTVEGTEVSLLGFIPRKRRFGAGAVAGAAMMLVAFVSALVVVPGRVASNGLVLGHRAAPLSAALQITRSKANAVEPIPAVVRASTPARSIAPRIVYVSPPVSAAASVAPPSPAPVSAQPPVFAATASTELPASQQQRRRRPIDAVDPWNSSTNNN